MTKYHWAVTECVGAAEVMGALNDAERGGAVETRIVFCGHVLVSEPSLISNQTPTQKPFFAVFARFPQDSGAQRV